jgi:hypothetical protein
LDWILLLIFIYKKDTLQMINFLIQLVNNTKSFAIIQKINLIIIVKSIQKSLWTSCASFTHQ